MTQGPNVKRLIAWQMARLAVPAGSPRPGLADGLALFTTPGRLAAVAREATDWAGQALAAVRACRDNPYPDDEAIAGAILAALDRQKTGGRG